MEKQKRILNALENDKRGKMNCVEMHRDEAKSRLQKRSQSSGKINPIQRSERSVTEETATAILPEVEAVKETAEERTAMRIEKREESTKVRAMEPSEKGARCHRTIGEFRKDNVNGRSSCSEATL